MRMGALSRIIGITLAVLAVLAFEQASFASYELVAVPDGVVEIERGKGRLVRLDKPAAAVFVANPEIADVQIKSPTLIYVFGSVAGETTLFAVDSGDRVVANVTLRVGHNLSRMSDAIKALAPGSDVDVYSVDGSLVLDGAVPSADVALEIARVAARFVPENDGVINRITIDMPNQVNLRVRVAEVSRTAVKSLGINWESAFDIGSNFGLALGLGDDILFDGADILRPGTGENSVFASFNSSQASINTLIDALANEGLITVLAEPNLTAASGEQAGFLAGGEFPVPIPGRDGAITIQFKEFGVQLSFTPVVLNDQRISLRVQPEVSQLSAAGAIEIDGFVIPALTTRRAETTVELASGQSFAIAGLIQNNLNHDISKFPGLGDVPVLGTLFRSDEFQRDESELVIIVTPYLVRAATTDTLALPTEGHIPPNDLERILDGRNYNEEMLPGPDDPHLIGDAGFMLD